MSPQIVFKETGLLDSATELEHAGLTGTKSRYRIGEQSRARQIADNDTAVRVGSAADMVCRCGPGARRQAAVLSDDDVVGCQHVIAGTARARYVRIGNRIFNLGPRHGISRAADSGRIDHRGRLVEANKSRVETIDSVIRNARRIGRSSAHYQVAPGCPSGPSRTAP